MTHYLIKLAFENQEALNRLVVEQEALEQRRQAGLPELEPRWLCRQTKKKIVRQRLRLRDGDDCWYCGFPLNFAIGLNMPSDYATIEHLIDRQYGGYNHVENLVLAHPKCNSRANNLTLEQKYERRQRWRTKNGFDATPYVPAWLWLFPKEKLSEDRD